MAIYQGEIPLEGSVCRLESIATDLAKSWIQRDHGRWSTDGD